MLPALALNCHQTNTVQDYQGAFGGLHLAILELVAEVSMSGTDSSLGRMRASCHFRAHRFRICTTRRSAKLTVRGTWPTVGGRKMASRCCNYSLEYVAAVGPAD